MILRYWTLIFVCILSGCLTTPDTPRDPLQHRYGVLIEQAGQASRSALRELRTATAHAGLHSQMMNIQRFAINDAQIHLSPELLREELGAATNLAEGISYYGRLLANDQMRSQISLSWIAPTLQIAGLASPATTAAIAALTALVNTDDDLLYQRRTALPEPLSVLADQLDPNGLGLAARYGLAVELLDLSLLDAAMDESSIAGTVRIQAMMALKQHQENIQHLEELSAFLETLARLPYRVDPDQLDALMLDISRLRLQRASQLLPY